MITYQEEGLADCLEEMKPLLAKHWDEIALHKDKIKLNPDYDTYLNLDEAGLLHVMTARSDGILIGYFVSFVRPNLHYSDTLFAVNDILFVDPDYRKGSVGYKLFKKSEKSLKDIGVKVIMIHSKVHQDFKPLMDKLGYDRVEYVYGKYTGEL